MDLTVGHRQYAMESIGEVSMPMLVSYFAHTIISTRNV